MKRIIISAFAITLLNAACTSEKETPKVVTISGEELFSKVKKFVSLGEHRTGTPVDSATSAWLKSELDSIGAKTEFVEFSLTQFFFESGKLKIEEKNLELFPVWPVKEGLNLSVTSKVLDGDKLSKIKDAKGKLIFTRLKDAHGSSNPKITEQINAFIKEGAKGVIAVTENNTGEIVALNTYENLAPWNAPVYLLAPKDTSVVLEAISKKTEVASEVTGNLKEVKARNILAKIGTGKQYVVVSTPISGWYTTGGERGPGIAVWLGLAKWASQNASKFPDYTFVFTGHSGHELDILGARAFVAKAAPKPDETKLWIHLGAAVAVREWAEENGKWILTDSVDSKRGVYYSESVATAFEKSFEKIKAKKSKGTELNKDTVKAGGEGSLFQKQGYKNLVSIAYAHRYHHVKTDNQEATSPTILLELEQALEDFITKQITPAQ